jgi:hypothetical protein
MAQLSTTAPGPVGPVVRSVDAELALTPLGVTVDASQPRLVPDSVELTALGGEGTVTAGPAIQRQRYVFNPAANLGLPGFATNGRRRRRR